MTYYKSLHVWESLKVFRCMHHLCCPWNLTPSVYMTNNNKHLLLLVYVIIIILFCSKALYHTSANDNTKSHYPWHLLMFVHDLHVHFSLQGKMIWHMTHILSHTSCTKQCYICVLVTCWHTTLILSVCTLFHEHFIMGIPYVEYISADRMWWCIVSCHAYIIRFCFLSVIGMLYLSHICIKSV